METPLWVLLASNRVLKGTVKTVAVSPSPAEALRAEVSRRRSTVGGGVRGAALAKATRKEAVMGMEVFIVGDG